MDAALEELKTALEDPTEVQAALDRRAKRISEEVPAQTKTHRSRLEAFEHFFERRSEKLSRNEPSDAPVG